MGVPVAPDPVEYKTGSTASLISNSGWTAFDYLHLKDRNMIVRFSFILLLIVQVCALCGCLYRGEGIFKRIGDSDYKARLNFQNLVAVGDGGLTAVSGMVLLDDHFTPLRNVPVRLRRKNDQAVVSSTQADNVGRFSLTGILYNESYVVEIESRQYSGSKEIIVSPNRVNCHEIFAKKQ